MIIEWVMMIYKLAAGIMSGTSLDGIDVSIAKIKGQNEETKLEFIAGITVSWSLNVLNKLKKVIDLNSSNVRLISELNFEIAYEYFNALNKLCKEHSINTSDLDFISIHGQTVWHDPSNKEMPTTLQIGDGAVLSALARTTVVSNFRVKDVVYGGQGAPLVPLVDKFIYGKFKKTISAHNLGGISNLTLIDNGKVVLAFDTGPANMMINYFAKKLFNVDYDDKGTIASTGKLIKELYNEVMRQSFFKENPPKSTGRELFGDHYAKYLLDKYNGYKKEDYLYTITLITVDSIVNSYKKLLKEYQIDEIVFSGGGVHNDFIITEIIKKLPQISISKSDKYGVSSDFKEAIAFLILGNQTLNYQVGNVKSATGASEDLILGQVSYYDKRGI